MNTQSPIIEIGTGVSHAPDSHEAGVSAVSSALFNIRQFPLSVVVVYASVHYNLHQVLDGIRSTVGDASILGTTTAGEICGVTHQHSVTVVVIASSYLSVHAAIGNRVSEDWQRALTQAVENPAISAYVKGDQYLSADLISSGKSLFAMIFYPGNTRTASSMGYELLETFKRISLGHIPVFGGASADDWKMESNAVFLGGQVHHDSVLVAIFETELEVGISLGHGFLPIGQKMTVTAVEGHEIISLNQRPAADVMAVCMGESRVDLEGQHITLATGYPIGSPDPMGQYSVNIASYLTQRGGVRMTQPVSIGSEITLLVHDADNSVLAGQEAVRKAMIRAGTNAPALILVHYCALRPRIMSESLAQMEMSNLFEIAGSAATAGFLSFGEDAVADDGISRHNNGAVAVLVLGKQFSATAKVAQENKRLLHQIEEQERANAANLSRVMFENSPTGMVAIDPNNGRIVQANNYELKMLGYTGEEILTKTVADITYPEDRAKSQQLYEKISDGTVDKLSYEKRYLRKDGSNFWVEVNVSTLKDANGKVSLFIGNAIDITERKKAESEIRIAATAFESQEGMNITDAGGKILRVNRAFTKITGYTAEEAIGKRPSLIKSGHHDEDFYAAMWESIQHTGVWEGEIWNRRKNGEVYPEHLTITAVKNAEGAVTNYVSTHTDITLTKAAEDEIKHLAFYDPLTRLPNRRLLLDRLRQALSSSGRSGRTGALLFIDLDNFKTLNDTLGHDIGDLLLQQVAKRLESCVREGDTVARLGGDEFVMMLEDLSKDSIEAAEQTESIGNKILTALNQPYQLATHKYHNTPSIGATLFNNNLQKIDELMKQADIAMYQSKKSGRNTLHFFDPQMQETINTRATLERELRSALEKQQFKLHYQVQVNGNREGVAYRPLGAEALIRWKHPDRGLVSPAEFIPLAEETGLILPIGQWVLETACAQIKAWKQNDLTRDFVLAVNVSANQFRQPDFVAQVQIAVHDHAINPNLLKLELTESLLLEDIEDTITTMNALNEIGVQFSLDDFGTGYSSLQYIKRLPLDQLKIDQSFVRDIVSDSSDRAIVRTIIAMARSLNLNYIAEGVETEEQRQLLLNMGCTHYQGYLFGKPLPIEEFEAQLKQD